jgi:regulator of nucleoside diphosphate kinase
MDSTLNAGRVFTQLDHARLTRLVSAQTGVPADIAKALEAVLWDGDVVASPSVPPQVVTMYSQVLVQEDGLPARKLALCYPGDADASAGFVSVLSPIGRAMLGLRVGQAARWLSPDGSEHSARIVEMLFQPEMSGDYTT